MERSSYRGIMTPAMVLTLVTGVWMWLGYGVTGGWLHAKLALVRPARRLSRLAGRAAARLRARRRTAIPTSLLPLGQRGAAGAARGDRGPRGREALLDDGHRATDPGQAGQRHPPFLRAVPARPRAGARRGARRARREGDDALPRRACRSPAPYDLVYIANLHSRIASRILWRVAQFPYAKEDDIYQGAAAVRWSTYFNADRTFKVDTNAHKSPVKSLDFITLRVKDAIADQFRAAMGKRPSVESRNPDVRVHVFLDAKVCTLYVDTSGESLFKRGKRDHVGEAPLKKNLAAGILRLAGWKPGIAAARSHVRRRGRSSRRRRRCRSGARAGRAREFAFDEARALQRGDVGAAAWRTPKKGERAASRSPIHGSDLYGRSLGHAAMNLQESGLARRGEPQAGEPARALRARARRHDRHQPALRRAPGREGRARRVLSEAGRRCSSRSSTAGPRSSSRATRSSRS